MFNLLYHLCCQSSFYSHYIYCNWRPEKDVFFLWMPQTLILTTYHQNIILMIRIPMVVLISLLIRIIVIIVNFSLKTTASLFVDLSPLLPFPLTLLGLDSNQKLHLGYADPDQVEVGPTILSCQITFNAQSTT